jgi:hypothetical protein
MASGDTLLVFTPAVGEQPAANGAVLDYRGTHPVLQFDDTTAQSTVFTAVLPRSYAGGGLTVRVHSTAVAVAGTVGWTVEVERIGTVQDIDSDGYAAPQTIVAVAVNATSGIVTIASVAIANGAGMDSPVDGDTIRIRITRDVANDTAVGKAQIVAVEVEET